MRLLMSVVSVALVAKGSNGLQGSRVSVGSEVDDVRTSIVLVVQQYGAELIPIVVLGHGALGIGQQTESESLGSTRLFTSGSYLSVVNFTLLNLGVQSTATDTLYTEGTLLHNTFVTNGNVGIKKLLHRLGPGGIREVKHPHVIRTVVGANPGTDTTVVDLTIQSVVGVNRRKNRTNRLTRGGTTLLT